MTLKLSYSTLLAAVVLSVTGIIAGFGVASADDNNGPIKRRRKPIGGKLVKGSYIIQLADTFNATEVKATAMETASNVQAMKQQIMANGTISTTDSLVNMPVTPSLVFTECIKGFVLTGVPEEIYQTLLETTGVTRVEPDRTVSIYDTLTDDSRHLLTQYNDRKASGQNSTLSLQAISQVKPWGITRVRGPIKTNPNPNGRIFVIDTGIAQVSDLTVDTTLSVNFAGGSNSPRWSDGNGHGTHVAGTIAAIDNSINVVGVVPGASVVAVRVLDNSGSGYISNVIAGINYVVSKRKAGDVANMSLGGGFSSSLNAAVNGAAAKGVKFAVAAGNSAADAKYYSPASASRAYTVSCYDSFDTLCSFSNYGRVVDYSGPGLNVQSLSRFGGTLTLSGTSMSTPHIAGLLFSGKIGIGGFINGDHDGKPDPIAVYSGA
jgi:hypothetical protein